MLTQQGGQLTESSLQRRINSAAVSRNKLQQDAVFGDKTDSRIGYAHDTLCRK
jgi:hypothetical protein